jgi:septal ring factor EnvC (AmiA/AmiB activator)
MSKEKVKRELAKVTEQLASLQKREAHLKQELKSAEDAEKQSILDKHHISVEELTEMINAKKAEEKRLLAMAKAKESADNAERSETNNE